MYPSHILTYKIQPRKSDSQKQPGNDVSGDVLVPVRQSGLLLGFYENSAGRTPATRPKVTSRYPDVAARDAMTSHPRQMTSSQRSTALHRSGIWPQRITAEVTWPELATDFYRRNVEVGMESMRSGNQKTQETAMFEPLGFESNRLIGMPAKDWIRLVRANPDDPVSQRTRSKNNSPVTGNLSRKSGTRQEFKTASGGSMTSGLVTFGSITSDLVTSGSVTSGSAISGSVTSGSVISGSVAGKNVPPPYFIRTRPSNSAFGVRNRPSVASLFQHSCENIFASNKLGNHWTMTGNQLFLRKRPQDLYRLASSRSTEPSRTSRPRIEYHYAKTPFNSPTPRSNNDDDNDDDDDDDNDDNEDDNDNNEDVDNNDDHSTNNDKIFIVNR